ncbi:pilus assembly protein [Vibrio fluvialis]|uniref:TadE/TadG family type IV pilus assembly protein n=1 Tax=Vibrio fluvialis TaxID=676 RepID=UPI001C9BDEFA|nr:TadE/TadG family type IV pilus assembly protein [Vibrio fluvialis]MBY7804555.1 pilus assembly protein [Vibrio fluvialis]MBY7838601.1 pilus assembly protein [Vibrio fluvialis]MBY7844418.1 pilus assembly protein [Vibrio fluvialis]MBY7864119.1 pilus assembly protein [Vibrio fluvialis]MBY7869702.1 pilus assembly protein [Vibrio fluvialis]
MKYERRRKQYGLAAVEFTIVLPLLLLLLAAVAEFGNLFIRYNTLSKAVQNGARMAVVEVYGTAKADKIASDDKIEKAVKYGNPEVIPDANTKPVLDSLTVNIVHNGNYVTVTAQYPYQPFLGVLLDNILDGTILTSSAVMRVTP